MTFWNVFFGVFSGIIAGVLINIGIGFISGKIARKKTKENLKFEIDFNIEKLNSFEDELRTFQEKVNSGRILEYLGYVSLTKVITTTIVQMFFDRSIYKILKYDDIGKLQNFYRAYSFDTERLINDQIRWGKDHFADPDIRQKAGRTVDFWMAIFNASKSDLSNVKAKLN